MLKEKKVKQANILGEYYEARRKALIELAEARKRLLPARKDKTEKNPHKLKF